MKLYFTQMVLMTLGTRRKVNRKTNNQTPMKQKAEDKFIVKIIYLSMFMS